MISVGKLLLILGGVIFLLGVIVVVGGKLNLPLGRLPGDVLYRGKHTTFYFPVATSIVLSILLSLIFYLIGRFR
jgi:Protein of unknown function (DUF2905)